MSQSAFSQMITRMEAQIGVRLLERTTRSVSLTPEGELLVPVAQRLLEDIRQVSAELRDYAQGRKGKVAVAALPSLSDEWLPRVFSIFCQRFPDIRMQLFDVISEPGLELLRRGDVDFALNGGTTISDEFDVRLLFLERFFLVCRPDHILADREYIQIHDLIDCVYIHSNKNGSVWAYLGPLIQDLPLRDSGFEVIQFGTLAGLIANGLGVTVIPEFSLHQFRRRGLCAVPIHDKRLERPLQIVTRRGRALSVAAAALVKVIEAIPPRHLL